MALITFDMRTVNANFSALSGKTLNRVAVRTLNKVATNVRTGASTAIRKRRALSAKAVRDAMSIKKATPEKLESSLVVTGRPIPLKGYKARQTKKGVYVNVSPGGRKLVTHAGNNAFIVDNIGGHVFAREGKKRLPIKKLFGPSLPSTFLQEQVKAAWTAVAKDVMLKRAAEELKYELGKLKR